VNGQKHRKHIPYALKTLSEVLSLSMVCIRYQLLIGVSYCNDTCQFAMGTGFGMLSLRQINRGVYL